MQVNQMRGMLSNPDRMLRDKQTRNPTTKKEESPCQDRDGGQNLYRGAARFSDRAVIVLHSANSDSY